MLGRATVGFGFASFSVSFFHPGASLLVSWLVFCASLYDIFLAFVSIVVSTSPREMSHTSSGAVMLLWC